MASYNLVVIAGNLTRDVEIRHIASGTAVADISIAVNDRRKQANGEWVDEVSFIDVTLWGRTAEIASEYLTKGSNVLIEGRLKQDRWEKDGQKHSKLKVTCDRMVMLGGRGGDKGAGGGQGGASAGNSGGGRSQRGGSQFDQPADDFSSGGYQDSPSSSSSSKDDIPF